MALAFGDTVSYILIVDDDTDVCDVVEMIIESQFDYKVVKANSGNQAIRILQEEPSPLAIFTDYRMYDGSGGDLYLHAREHNKNVPVCLISTYRAKDLEEFKTFFDDNPFNDALLKPFKPDEIIEFVTKVGDSLKKEKLVSPQKTFSDYVKVNIEKFLATPIVADVFLKLSDSKFVKIKKEEDGEDYESISKYITKGAKDIYLQPKDYDLYVDSKIATLFDKKVSKDFSDTIPNVEAISELHNCVLELGINEKTIHLVDKSIEMTMQSIEKEGFPSIVEKLGKFDAYLYNQSYLTAYIASFIAKHVSWESYYADYNDIKRAFTVAALFQNISLVENSKISEIHSLEDSRWNGLSHSEKELVKSHSIDSYNTVQLLVVKYKHIGNLIVNHHEQPGGRGYPAGVSGVELDLHEAIFIIAVNFAHDVLKKEMSKKDMRGLVESYRSKYDKEEPFKLAYNSFASSFDQIFS